jgi:hypothetical protein
MAVGAEQLERSKHLVEILEGAQAIDDVARYYRENLDGPNFDLLGRSAGVDPEPNRIAPIDLIAVTALSVSVPARTAVLLLEDRATDVERLLLQIPADLDIWDDSAEALVTPQSTAAELWNLLESFDGVGWVVAHKLCARKRPRLLPVYDSVVKEQLQPNRKSYWVPLRASIRELQLVPQLERIKAEANVPKGVALLRVLDVAVWCEGVRQRK